MHEALAPVHARGRRRRAGDEVDDPQHAVKLMNEPTQDGPQQLEQVSLTQSIWTMNVISSPLFYLSILVFFY